MIRMSCFIIRRALSRRSRLGDLNWGTRGRKERGDGSGIWMLSAQRDEVNEAKDGFSVESLR